MDLAAASSRILTFSGVCRKSFPFQLSCNAPLYLNKFLYCSQVFISPFFAILHHIILELDFLHICLWPPSGPLLLPFHRWETLRNFILVFPRVDRVMTPQVPIFDIIEDAGFVGLPPGPEDVVLLRHQLLETAMISATALTFHCSSMSFSSVHIIQSPH